MHEIHEAFVMIVVVSTFWCIHREHQVVWTKAVPLGISIGEDPCLEQLIIRVVDSRDGDCWAESKLFIFREEIVDVLVEDHPSNWLQWDDILWPGLGYIKRVKIKPILMISINGLNEQLPFWVIPSCNRISQVLCGMGVAGASNSNGFIIQEALHATCRLPVELNKVRLSIPADQGVGVDTKTVHVPIVEWDANIIKEEGEHVQTLWVVRKEVNYSPVLLHIGLWAWLESMDHVRELHPISDKKHRHIVPNKVKVTLKIHASRCQLNLQVD